MKNKIYYLSLCLFVVLLSGCLDLDPISSVGESAFYKNESDVLQGVIACYNGMQAPMNNEWYLTELRTDNSRLHDSNSSAATSAEINMVDMYRVETSHSVNTRYWDNTYHNIANCNTVLQYLSVVENENSRKRFEAEAKFIRAYHYFNLVRLYGPLFLITERISGDQAKEIGRSSMEKVYELIVSDLLVASNELPEKLLETEKGRVDQWAAKALLGRVYLTLKDYDKAKPLLLEVENTAKSGYGLQTEYASVFSIDNEMNSEIIFAVRYKAGNVGLGASFANNFAPAMSDAFVINGGGSGFNCPTQSLVNAYSDEDKRKNVCLAPFWMKNEEKVYMPYVMKYFSSVVVKNDAENDWPVIRYADVVLMLAEIENETSGPVDALPRLNAIRDRAGLDELEISEVSDKYKFRKALFEERRLEFAFENHRFFDLIRSNQLIPVMKSHFDVEQEINKNSGAEDASSFYKDSSKNTYMLNTTLEQWQLLLPIPLNTMTVSPKATQNPGY